MLQGWGGCKALHWSREYPVQQRLDHPLNMPSWLGALPHQVPSCERFLSHDIVNFQLVAVISHHCDADEYMRRIQTAAW